MKGKTIRLQRRSKMLTSNISPPGRWTPIPKRKKCTPPAHSQKEEEEDVKWKSKKKVCLLDTVNSLRGALTHKKGQAHRNQLMGQKLESNRKVRIPKCWHVHLGEVPRESFSDRQCLWLASRRSAFAFCDDPVDMSGCVNGGVCVHVCFFVCVCVCGGVTRPSPRQSRPKITERRGRRWRSLPAIIFDHMSQLDDELAFFVFLTAFKRMLLEEKQNRGKVRN